MSNPTVSPLMLTSPGPAPAGTILVETGSLAGTRFPLTRRTDVLTLGREVDCTIRFDPNQERMVGRHHARIEVRDDGVYLIDSNSANGTFRNGAAVSEVRLQDGDRFQLGGEVEGAQGPWVSIQLTPPPQVAVHAKPMSTDSATVIIRPWGPDSTLPPQAATHAPPTFLPPPVVPPPVLPDPPPLRTMTPPPRVAEPPRAPAVRRDTMIAAPVIDPLHRQRREYLLRQIVVIAALLMVACGVGLVLGQRGAADADSDYATHGE